MRANETQFHMFCLIVTTASTEVQRSAGLLKSISRKKDDGNGGKLSEFSNEINFCNLIRFSPKVSLIGFFDIYN